MKAIRQYDIDIFGLADKEYTFDYTSGNDFFEALEQDLIQQGQFKTHVVLDKSATMIRLDFSISGSVQLECDRTLEPFDEPLDISERFFLKFGDHNEELTEEIEIITRQTTRINLAKYIYDFIVLALPVKRIHPRLRDEEWDNDEEEEVLIYSSSDSKNEDTPDDSPIDPRWEALKKLNNNKENE